MFRLLIDANFQGANRLFCYLKITMIEEVTSDVIFREHKYKR